MKFIPNYSKAPDIGEEKIKRKFIIFPRQCPMTGTYYFLQTCTFHYKYGSFCSDTNDYWYLVKITD